jgi:phospholipase/carboxylesterase
MSVMTHEQNETDEDVVLEPANTARATVIWMHGLGADGYDFVPLVPELRLPAALAVRFIFPHAPVRPVTINNGYPMRAWYDIKALALSGPEDRATIHEAQQQINGYIERERAKGIAAERILLAGFSQGGAVALQTALRYPEKLAGILALSTYLPLAATLAAEASAANRAIPILMCHGRADPVLPMVLGLASRDQLQALGYAVDWREYPMQHEVCREEVAAIASWLAARLG